MNLSPIPNTPVRTPQLRSSAKGLQLTPIWQEVVQHSRLPPDVSQDLVFQEISARLEDLEWPVRQHAFRVLCDIIPVVAKERLDERIAQSNIFAKMVVNLGHPAPGIRKVAADTLQKYLRRTGQPERMLESFVQYGVREEGLVSNDEAGILRENITLGTIVALADVLKPFVIPENGGYSLSQSLLTKIIDALAAQGRKAVFREKCLESLGKIRQMVGEPRFGRTLDNVYGKDGMMNLMNLKNDVHWSEKDFGVLGSEDSFELPLLKEDKGIANQKKNYSSEEFSDGSDTETYTKEPAPSLDDDTIYYHVHRAEVSPYVSPSFVPVEHSDNFLHKTDPKEDKEGSESGSLSPRVVLEAEIQFAKNKAITMKVVEEDEKGQKRFTTENGDLVMKVLEDSEDVQEEEKTRTPRRVRFGGEVIKLRTPDSETTDITIEIHEAGGGGGAGAGAADKEPALAIAPEPKSHIPLPLAPVTRTPSREPSPSRRAEASRSDSFDSAPSSGSEGEDEEGAWKWAEMRLVEENILKDLKNKENWKIQYQALEQLKIVLINPKTVERLEKSKSHESLNSLFHCLLHCLPQSNNQQVTALALSIVSQLIETLPKDLILQDVEDIVQGLCRYVGGCKNLNLKIEAVQSLKTLFGTLEPSSVMDVLVGERCLFSPTSKLRENSLLAIMYALMTFPSDVFDVEKLLRKVTAAAADVRRRVRHAALEAIAILSQFCPSQSLAEAVARAADTLPGSSARAGLIAGVQARLSRRLLPTISSEGLVLYALQIPASRRFGNAGNPMGADVDWILSGTGSISTGSAKSKTQLNAAQRLETKPPAPAAPASPSKWASKDPALGPAPPPPQAADNPWKIQKHRTESTTAADRRQLETFRKTQSTGGLSGGHHLRRGSLGRAEPDNRLRPEEITWALVPVSALGRLLPAENDREREGKSGKPAVRDQRMLLCRVVGYRPFVFASHKDEPAVGRERSSSLWGEGDGAAGFLSAPFGHLRPVYLKLQPAHEHLFLSRSTEDVRRTGCAFGEKKSSEDFTEVRLLTPTILREKNYTDNNSYSKKSQTTDVRDTPTRIPVLCPPGAPRTVHRPQRAALLSARAADRKTVDPEDVSPESQKHNGLPNGFSATPTFLPSIHGGHQRQQSPNFEGDDEAKLRDTMAQLSGLLTASKGGRKSPSRDFYTVKSQPEPSKEPMESALFEEKIQNKVPDRSYHKSRESLPSAVASAPPVISADSGDHVPSTSSSNSTDFGTLSGSELRVRKLAGRSAAFDGGGGLPYRNYATYNPKHKGKKVSLGKNSQNKVGMNGNAFPDTLRPFERPKEGLETCFNQLESQQWEVNMLGLTSLVRLLRHHPAIVLGHLHPIIVALGRQIKNLRSQVARVACQASAEMFLALKRNVEPDLEELSGPLFHRSADTNRFIRADCNHALDNMVDSVGHAKAVSVIISKGTTHQNATVRAVAARLLLRLSEKAGAEKLLSLPKECRDKMLQAGANLLTEGKLETRAFAKQVFRVWSSHSSFSSLIVEAVQPNVLRHISKTLISLKS